MARNWLAAMVLAALVTVSADAGDAVYEYEALTGTTAFDIDAAATVPGQASLSRDGAAVPGSQPPLALADRLAAAGDEAAIVHLFSSGADGVFNARRDMTVAAGNVLRVGVPAAGGPGGGNTFLILADEPEGGFDTVMLEQNRPAYNLDIAGSVEIAGDTHHAVVSAKDLTVREGGSLAVMTNDMGVGRLYVDCIDTAGFFHIELDSEVRVRATGGAGSGYGLTVRGGHMLVDGFLDLSAAADIDGAPPTEAYHRGISVTGGKLEVGEFGVLDFKFLPGYRIDVAGGHLHFKPFMLDFAGVDFAMTGGELELGSAASGTAPALDSILTAGHTDLDGGTVRLNGMSELTTFSGSTGGGGDWRIGSRVKAVTDGSCCARLIGVDGKTVSLDGVVDITEGNLAITTNGGLTVVNGAIHADKTYSLRLEGGELAMGAGASVSLGTDRLAAIAAATADGVVDRAALSGEDVLAEGIGKSGDFADGSAYEYSFRSALGRFTVVADTSGAEAALVVGRGEGVVSFAGTSVAEAAADKRNFSANVGGIYRAPVAASGLADTAFRAVAGTVAADDAYRPLTPDAASAPGQYNNAFLNAFASGDGNPFSVALPGSGNDAPACESRVTGGLLDAYVGNNQGGYAMASVAAAGDNRQAVTTRIQQINRQWAAVRQVAGDGALAAAAMNADAVNRVWAGVLGQWEDTAARDGLDGYRYNSYGLMAGADAAFAGCFVAGASFGYTTGDYRNKAMQSNDSTIDTYSVNAYLGYNHPSGLYATLAGGYVHAGNTVKEADAGGAYRERFDAGTWHAGATVGYELRPVPAVHISPSIGLAYIATATDAHSRTMEGVGDILRYGRMRYDSAVLPVDVTVGYDVPAGDGQLVRLSANGGYSYNFDADGADGSVFLNGLGGGGVSYAAVTRQNGHHTWNIGFGAKFTSALWEVGGKYDYYARSSTNTHRLGAFVARRF